jgi:hypothetical protein
VAFRAISANPAIERFASRQFEAQILASTLRQTKGVCFPEISFGDNPDMADNYKPSAHPTDADYAFPLGKVSSHPNWATCTNKATLRWRIAAKAE